MSPYLTQDRGIARPFLTIALVATATVVMPCPRAFAAKPAKVDPAHIAKQVHRNGRALVTGTLVDGPQHTFQAIRQKPVRYVGMLLAVGVVGGVAKLVGVNPEPYMLGLSALTLGISVKQSWPGLVAATGARRLRAIGRDVLWPSALFVGTAGLGKLVPSDKARAAVTLTDAAMAGVQSIVIGADAPTIAQGMFDARTRRP